MYKHLTPEERMLVGVLLAIELVAQSIRLFLVIRARRRA